MMNLAMQLCRSELLALTLSLRSSVDLQVFALILMDSQGSLITCYEPKTGQFL